jgi:hypothetical protein
MLRAFERLERDPHGGTTQGDDPGRGDTTR